MKVLPNGNIEITVQLLPDAYAALRMAAERDDAALVDIVNVAVLAYDAISQAAKQAGKPIGLAEGEVAP